MFIHFLMAVIGVLSSFAIPETPRISLTLFFAFTSGLSLARLLQVSIRNKLANSTFPLVIPMLMWVWYFSPAILYSFDIFYVDNFLIFEEQYLVKSLAIFSAFFSLFSMGVEISIRRQDVVRSGPDDSEAETLNWNGLVLFSSLGVATGILSYIYRPQLVLLGDVENFIDTYSDHAANIEANTFSSIMVVWGLCMSVIIRNILQGSSPLWLVTALPGVVAMLIATSTSGRRQAIVHAAVVIVYPLIVYARRRTLLFLVLVISCLVVLLGWLDLFRRTGGEVGLNFLSVLEAPLVNFANTASFHARSVFYYENTGFLFGRSFLVNPIVIVPFGSRIFGSQEIVNYNQAPVIATVDFAQDRAFGMGGSMFSELHANFGLPGLMLSLMAGIGYGSWVYYCWRSRGKLSNFMVAACILLVCVWYTRSSLQSSLGMVRYVLIAGILVTFAKISGSYSARGAKVRMRNVPADTLQ